MALLKLINASTVKQNLTETVPIAMIPICHSTHAVMKNASFMFVSPAILDH